MKKIICFICISMLAVSFILTACAGEDKNIETKTAKESSVMNDGKVLSLEEFIRLSGISAEKYSDIDLERFIEEYEITEESLKNLNIELLLEDYRTLSTTVNVSDIFDKEAEGRTADFADDIVAVAFYENINTGIKSVYYDLENKCRYRLADGYVFDDLNRAEKEEYPESDQLAESLEKNGVFTWVNAEDTEGISDPQAMALAVEYKDGSVFRVSASGILSQLLPSNYDLVSDMLLN